MKYCRICKQEKDLSEFSIRNKKKGYLKSYCKTCTEMIAAARHKKTYIPREKVKKPLSIKLQAVKDRIETPGYFDKVIDQPDFIERISRKCMIL